MGVQCLCTSIISQAQDLVIAVYEHQGIQITPGVIEALQKTHDYALSIFLEFMLNVDGKCVSVSGKSFRIYSALRWELMCFFINTHLMVASDLNQNQNSSQTEHGTGPVDPLKLAERLCTRLTSAPVHEIIHDEEDHTVIRIAQFMLHKELREELECFIGSEMGMPFHMHSAHRALWLAVVKANTGATTAFSLPELLEVFQAVVQEILKPAWLAFAADCADNFVSRGHFIEKADDVWKSAATLNDFVSLRMKYLIHLLSQTLAAAEAGQINFEANAISKAGLKIFASIDLKDDSIFQMLSVLDMLSASGDTWPKVWSEALQKKCSPQDVASFVADTLQIDIKALKDKWIAPKNSKVLGGDGDGHQTRLSAEGAGEDEDAQNQSAHESKIDKDKQQEDEPDAEFDPSKRSFSLGRLMLFSGTSGSDLFDCSPEALELGIDKVSVMDIMNVKAQLEYLVWDQYTKDMIASGAFDWIVAKVDQKKKSDLLLQADVKTVKKNLEDEKGMFLPFAGSISIVPSKDSVKLAKVFGVEFFIRKAGCETQTLCPAWMARAVTREDQAFFEAKAFKKTIYMYLQSEEELDSSHPTSEKQKEKEKKDDDDDDENSEPVHHDLILTWEKPEEESAQSVVEVSVHWAGICPDPKLDSKLTEIAKAKEAKSQKKKIRNQKRRAALQKKLDTLIKKNDEVGAAGIKKQMGKLDGQGDDESEDGGAAVDLNECIPITRMQTPAEFEQKSARSKALADALLAAEDGVVDSSNFGITGFKRALEESGFLKSKAKKKVTTDKSVQDVLKMGSHLLK